ncbi:hypothetical protein P5673_016888 [Acropora cervicornis]|uniref:Uncharacterized protein n=1 Tax=Acropora cervicornis TaxID=6130 RepID=A0AAD9QFV7_ACRCE|nr:hypothetical protein P5673_016888 [Acropora cervicornis]
MAMKFFLLCDGKFSATTANSNKRSKPIESITMPRGKTITQEDEKTFRIQIKIKGNVEFRHSIQDVICSV